MSWYERAEPGLSGATSPHRRVMLALGGIALAAGLGWTLSASRLTARTPAPARARTQALHDQPPPTSPPDEELATGEAPPVAQDMLQAMRQRKNACVRSLITLLQDRRRIMQRLEAEHPELQEIPQLQKWLNKMPAQQFPAGAQQWLALPKNEVMGQRFFELMVLKNAGVWMALLDDPKYGPWHAALFEPGGLSAQAVHDLQVLDTAAKFNDAATAQPTTPAEVRAAYALREPAYEAAAQARAREWGLRITPEMDDYLQASAQQMVMQRFLKQYYERLLDDETAMVDARLAALQAEFQSFPEAVKADPELIVALRQAAGE